MPGSIRSLLGSRRALWLVLLLSVALRVAVAFYLGDGVPAGKDETSYSVLATRVANGEGFSFPEGWYPFTPANTPTAHWSFLYTALVAGVYAAVGPHPLAARLLSAVLGGLLLPWMLYRLVRRLRPDAPEVALGAALLGGLYAYFVLYAAQIMTETAYIIAVLWSLERALALHAAVSSGEYPRLGLVAGFGASVGIATLLRQAFLPWAVVCFGWLLLLGLRRRRLRQSLVAVGLSALISLLFILPFTIRNYLVYNDWLLLNSNAGYALYSAQHPLHGTQFEPFVAAPLPDDIEPRPENEAQWDRELMGRGIQFMSEEPGRIALLSLSRAAEYFTFWPSSQTSPLNNIGRVVSFGLLLPFMIYGLWISRHEWERCRVLYAFVFVYSLVHLLTWSMIRYRLPVDAVLLVFAALGLADLGRRLGVALPLRAFLQMPVEK